MSEVLVVSSKVKKYIKDEHGLKCSATTMEALTDVIKRTVDEAATACKKDKRKTLMDKDIG